MHLRSRPLDGTKPTIRNPKPERLNVRTLLVQVLRQSIERGEGVHDSSERIDHRRLSRLTPVRLHEQVSRGRSFRVPTHLKAT
jgi:hypothetical protein